MPGIDFNQLRREVTMQQVLNAIGFEATRRTGLQLKGPCPVHKSTRNHSTSFSVNLGSHRYFCHKCGSHGNQLELWAAICQLNLYEASIELCKVLNRGIPWITKW